MPHSKEEAKKLIKALVDFYNLNKDKMKGISETDTRIKLIDKLFQFLGWDVSGIQIQDEVQREEGVKGKESTKKKADYVFRLNGISRLVVEAKAQGESLDNDVYVTQAVNYAYNKACSWAVLTNFNRLFIFYVDRKGSTPFYKIDLADIKNFNMNFETLWFLSKESVSNKLLEAEAKRRGLKNDKFPIDQQLLNDLKRWREILSNDIKKGYGNDYEPHVIDEIVQRIIDRLIFIRKTEDANLEEPKLDPIIRRFSENTYKEIKKVFAEFREKYDSKLFGEDAKNIHECDRIDITNNIIEDVIRGMYKPKDSDIEYDFSAIDADILGNIYEQYLAYILTQTPKKVKLKGGVVHRKEQGIYYTPTLIVDFIVRNTLGELLKTTKLKNVSQIKVLDPACGSGSFLIKAYDILNEFYVRNDQNYQQTKLDPTGGIIFSKKVEILKNNIFGVDLDSKAVEIAQLNLLMKIAERGQRLPILQKNIKIGNSLVDDKKIGEDKAFKWEEEFKQIIDNDGFDIVIGNPPWSAKISSDLNKTLVRKYGLSEKNINICALFVLEALKRVKKNGVLGFLLPKVFIKNEVYRPVRKFILDNYQIKQIIDFGKFPGVASDAIGLIVKKGKDNSDTKISFFENGKIKKENRLNQDIFTKNSLYVFSISINEKIQQVLDKIKRNSEELRKIFNIKRGIELGQKSLITKCKKCGTYNEAETKYYGSTEKLCKKCKNKLYINKENVIKISSVYKNGIYTNECVAGTQINIYSMEKPYFIPLNLKGIDYKDEAFSGQKILIKRIATRIEGTFSENKTLAFNTVYSIYSKKLPRDQFLYTLGLLNSKLIQFFYEYSYNVGMNLTTQVTIDFLSKIPIKISETQKKSVVDLVEKILSFTKRLEEIGNKKTDERDRLEEEISRINKQIDQKVYEIYDLSKEEIRVIEES